MPGDAPGGRAGALLGLRAVLDGWDTRPPAAGPGASSRPDGRPGKVSLSLSERSAVYDPKLNRKMLAPLPNLFKATFEQAQRQSPGEVWLQQRIQAFDAGNKRARKEVLQEFLEYVGQTSACSLQELFSNQAHLFFVRLTSWFSITLPMSYELTLQLKVFLVFLEFREQAFIRAFFESGVVVPLMHALSVDFDVSDEVRCLTIMLLHKLAAAGRQHKEILCAQGLVPSILECAADGLRWETLKFAGRLLVELFHSNPKYQDQVLDALQDLMEQKLPITQRVGTQAFVSLMVGEGRAFPPILYEASRHRSLVKRALALLESHDLRVAADAYCLLCRLLRCFGCDELLFDFARTQMRSEKDNATEWLRLEVAAQVQGPGKGSIVPPGAPGWHRHQGAEKQLQEREKVAEELAKGPDTEMMRRVHLSNAEFCDAFRAEAENILKWGLLAYLAKRNPGLCTELVEGGWTETLLMCLLDVAHPVRQGAALAELHRLRLMSPKAQRLAERVLQKQYLLRAISLDQFMSSASADDLSSARIRLRNLRSQEGKARSQAYSAKEHGLQQHLMEKQMADALGIQPMSTTAFMTQAPHGPDQAAAPEAALPRGGPGVFPVKRVPLGPGAGYRTDCGPVEEVPFSDNLSSFLMDPLDVTADEASPLIQELRSLEASVGPFRLARRAPVEAAKAVRSQEAAEAARKASHKPSLEHTRALALQAMPARGVGLGRPPRRATAQGEESLRSGMQSRAESELTEVSLHMGGIDDPLSGQSWMQSHTHSHVHGPGCGCRGGSKGVEKKALSHLFSLAETSIGPDVSLGPDGTTLWFSEDRSRDLAGDSLEFMSSVHWEEEASLSTQLVHKTSVAAVSEVKCSVHADAARAGVQKRIVHVACAPYHDCIAFDKWQAEQDRKHAVDDITGLLQPATRRRFQELQKLEAFPRKWLVASGPHSARLPRERPARAGIGEGRGAPGDGQWVPVTARAHPPDATGGRSREGLSVTGDSQAQPQEVSMKDYFGASAAAVGARAE